VSSQAVVENAKSLDDATNSTDNWWSFIETQKFWKGLLVLGILLNVIVILTSDLGLDTHVRMAEDENGSLVWGHTRPIDTQSSDPSYAPENLNYDFTFGDSEFGIKIISLVIMGLLIGLAGSSVTIAGNGGEKYRLRAAAIVAIYPTFIFSTGRAYYEPIISALIIICVIPYILWEIEEQKSKRLLAILISTLTFSGVLIAKNINPIYCLIFGAALVLYFVIDNFAPNITRRPVKAATITICSITIAMIGYGILGDKGTLSIINDETGRFFFALLVSAIDMILIYSLFGMILWPFVGSAYKYIVEVEDLKASILSIIIAGFTTAITIYVAALWTFESVIWYAEWPWIMWTMGNNGRYISLVMIPAMMLIARLKLLNPELPSLAEPKGQAKSLAIGIMLILPLSLLASIHGQTFWTDDAAEVLDNNMEDAEDFLFIHEGTLGMHYLYTFHTGIDDVDERNITGHWRTPDSGWQEEMLGVTMDNRGNLSNVKWVIFSPSTDWIDGVPEGWSMNHRGSADFMNGGGDWEIWSTQTS